MMFSGSGLTSLIVWCLLGVIISGCCYFIGTTVLSSLHDYVGLLNILHECKRLHSMLDHHLKCVVIPPFTSDPWSVQDDPFPGRWSLRFNYYGSSGDGYLFLEAQEAAGITIAVCSGGSTEHERFFSGSSFDDVLLILRITGKDEPDNSLTSSSWVSPFLINVFRNKGNEELIENGDGPGECPLYTVPCYPAAVPVDRPFRDILLNDIL